jgi:hypothetical protein
MFPKAFPVAMIVNVLLLSVQGSPICSWFAISSQSGDQLSPRIAYNSQRQEYLVVWRNDGSHDDSVWGQLVSKNGTRIGFPLLIAGEAGAERR